MSQVRSKLPGLQKRRIQPGLRLRCSGLGRLADLHTPCCLPEAVASGIHLVDEIKQRLLELVAVVNIAALPELHNQLGQKFLRNLMPRMRQYLSPQWPLVTQLHSSSVSVDQPDVDGITHKPAGGARSRIYS